MEKTILTRREIEKEMMSSIRFAFMVEVSALVVFSLLFLSIDIAFAGWGYNVTVGRWLTAVLFVVIILDTIKALRLRHRIKSRRYTMVTSILKEKVDFRPRMGFYHGRSYAFLFEVGDKFKIPLRKYYKSSNHMMTGIQLFKRAIIGEKFLLVKAGKTVLVVYDLIYFDYQDTAW